MTRNLRQSNSFLINDGRRKFAVGQFLTHLSLCTTLLACASCESRYAADTRRFESDPCKLVSKPSGLQKVYHLENCGDEPIKIYINHKGIRQKELELKGSETFTWENSPDVTVFYGIGLKQVVD